MQFISVLLILTIIINVNALNYICVDTSSSSVSSSIRLAAKAAQGLINRDDKAIVYGDCHDNGDNEFLWNAVVGKKVNVTNANVFLSDVINNKLITNAIIYDVNDIDIMPTVITLAGVLDAIPLTSDMYTNSYSSLNMVMNTTNKWNNSMDANEFLYEHYLHQTSTLAFQKASLCADGFLVDFMIQQRHFVTYLKDKCHPGTDAYELTRKIIDNSKWPRPVHVFGYNSDPVLFGGDLYEAETNCNSQLGEIASDHAENLSFFTNYQKNNISIPKQYQSRSIKYNNSKSYVALVYGDLDNIEFVQSIGWQHMLQRKEKCEKDGKCFPLTWTLSPQLLNIAPKIMEWYYRTSITDYDWFIMPPSGSLYSYPAMFPDNVVKNFLTEMQSHGERMNTSGSIHWEWFLMWQVAFDRYFPRYENHQIQSFFLNQVPWVLDEIPTLLFGNTDTYKFITKNVVLFRPQFNWMYDNGGGGLPNPPDQIANMINKFAFGSVQYIYVIQNTPADKIFEMVSYLDSHVELVNYEELTSLAKQREEYLMMNKK